MSPMRCTFFTICALVSSLAVAEIDMPRGLYRGTLEKVDGSAAQGRVIARAANGEVSSCAYDSRTYMEADGERTSPLRLRIGDPLVIVADYRVGTGTCYTRTLHVAPSPKPNSHRAVAVVHKPAAIRVRGDRTISGRVVEVTPNQVMVRTRDDGDVALNLRPDTSYLGEGSLSVNLHVSIRAGRNLQGGLEAYQVSWAELLRE